MALDAEPCHQVANAVEVILAAPKKVPEGTKDRPLSSSQKTRAF